MGAGQDGHQGLRVSGEGNAALASAHRGGVPQGRRGFRLAHPGVIAQPDGSRATHRTRSHRDGSAGFIVAGPITVC
ncbi:MAG: hypothetical protein DLM60_19635 [Pseudonocardiales bacterium]|nr:MAG: hypothetical protein DLM60_19635 [Pseudonocardiales bacterium]